jgi:hypothetical protein
MELLKVELTFFGDDPSSDSPKTGIIFILSFVNVFTSLGLLWCIFTFPNAFTSLDSDSASLLDSCLGDSS